MSAGEIALAWLVGIGAGIGALVAIVNGVPKLWRFARKFVETVDVIATLPTRLDTIDAAATATATKLVDHLIEAQANTLILTDMREQMRPLVYQLQPNGGGSTVDRLGRLETGLQELRLGVEGLYATPGEHGVPGRTGPIPLPPARPSTRRRKPPQEPS